MHYTAPILTTLLQAHCVLEVLPAAPAESGTALSATVTLIPGMPLKPEVIGTIWEGVHQHTTSSKGKCNLSVYSRLSQLGLELPFLS